MLQNTLQINSFYTVFWNALFIFPCNHCAFTLYFATNIILHYNCVFPLYFATHYDPLHCTVFWRNTLWSTELQCIALYCSEGYCIGALLTCATSARNLFTSKPLCRWTASSNWGEKAAFEQTSDALMFHLQQRYLPKLRKPLGIKTTTEKKMQHR